MGLAISEILVFVLVVLSGITIYLLISVLRQFNGGRDFAQAIREEFYTNRNESSEDSRRLREELSGVGKAANEHLLNIIGELGKSQKDNIESIEQRIKSLADTNIDRLDRLRELIENQMKALQEGNESRIGKMNEAIIKNVNEMKQSQNENYASVERRVRAIADSNETRFDRMKDAVDKQLKSLQEQNDRKLEQMRKTVDEKLQGTLEKRLGESFKLVSERLEAVQRGLGDMQNLAAGVGDLKRVLTNVKTRGTWAEFQLGDILDQILSPEQFSRNVQPNPGSKEIVEYAVRLPGQDDSSDIWLPIDSKFPQEDYQRLMDAAEVADSEAVNQSTRSLIRTVKSSAKDISDKYIAPPETTDFAIMFLPTEGLYSEILRQPGMVEQLQREFRVVVAGPTTLTAILNSLRMGFRTLAIEKRSSEVWKILAAVKTEFSKFGGVLDKVKRQLATASNTIEETGVRTRAMERKLREVEALPESESDRLLEIDNAGLSADGNSD